MGLAIKALISLLFVAICSANPVWIWRHGSDDLYLILKGEVSWIFAREMCLAQGGDLLTIGSREELDWIIERIPVHPADNPATRERFVLVGLTDIENNRNWDWIDDTPLDTDLLEWEIHKDNIVENCAALMIKARKLTSLNCDFRILPAITTQIVCKSNYERLINRRLASRLSQVAFSLVRNRRELRLCEHGWYFYRNNCWKLVEVKRHWFHAQIHCWNNEGQAALADLQDPKDAAFLHELHNKIYGPIPDTGVWVNAFDSAEEGIWTTHDGRPVYIRWQEGVAPKDPDHRFNCLVELQDGTHRDVNCGHRISFFCRKPSALYYKRAKVAPPPGYTPNNLTVLIPPEFQQDL